MAALARARAWARGLKRDTVTLWLVARDPRTPWYAKAVAAAPAACWASAPGRQKPPLRHRTMWVVTAAVIAVSLASLGWVANLQFQVSMLRREAARYDAAATVLTSPGLTTRALASGRVDVQARGTTYLDPASGLGMVVVEGLPPLAADHTWQVWFARGSERLSGGLLETEPDGSSYALIQVPADLGHYDAVYLTDEPARGSPPADQPRRGRNVALRSGPTTGP